MNKRTVVGLACGAGLAGAAWLAVAGPLDPPGGAVQPTMRTLDEIYDSVEAIGAGIGGGTAWQAMYAVVNNNQQSVVVSGSGVLHGIWVTGQTPAGKIEYHDSASTAGNVSLRSVIVQPGTLRTQFYEFNARFENGIRLDNDGTTNTQQFTVLYSLD